MDPIYRFLGLVARLYERLGRVWFHFIPATWFLFVFFGTLAFLGANGARGIVVNGDRPRVVSLAEVLAHKDTDRNFVTVQGTLHPDPVFEQMRDGRRVAVFLRLSSDSDKSSLLVKYAADRVPSGKGAKDTAVTGMLKRLDREVSLRLSRMVGTPGAVLVDLAFMLVEGDTPGSLTANAVTALVGALCLFAMLLVRVWRLVVFRRTDEVDTAAVSPPTAGDLRASGVFRLREHRPRRFLDVPVALVQRESGYLAIVSDIDASSRLFGFKTADRSGPWSIVVSFDQMKKVETGNLYLGLRRRPALRIRFAVKGQRGAVVVVLSCSNVGHRLFVRHELARLAEWSQPAT